MAVRDAATQPCITITTRSLCVLEWTTAFVVLLLPFTLPFRVVFEGNATSASNSLVFFPVDLGLTAMVGVGLPIVASKLRQRQLSRPILLLMVFTGLTFAAAVVNPEPAAFQFSFRMGAVTILVSVLADLGTRLLHGPIMWAFVAIGLEQSIIAVGQSAMGRPLGLSLLGLGDNPSRTFPLSGGVPSVRGTLIYPYMLAGFAVLFATVVLAITLLGQKRPLLYAVTAALAVPIGLTYSRMSVLAVLALVVVLLTGRLCRRRRLTALSALMLGALVPAVCTLDGWIARGQNSVDATGADGLSSGRLTLVRQAWQLIQSAPVFGVGPANYSDALALREPSIDGVLYVHNVPLLAAAESGILSGLVFALLLVTLGAVALCSGAASLAIYCGLMPFILLDAIPYGTSPGMVLFGLWAGTLLAIASVESSERDRTMAGWEIADWELQARKP